MDNATALITIARDLETATTSIEALQVAQTILQNGYQSDQSKIDAGIQAGIAQAVQNATAPLQTQIDSIPTQISDAVAPVQTQLDTANAQVADLTNQVNTLTSQLQTERDAHTSDVSSLNAQISDLQAQIASNTQS